MLQQYAAPAVHMMVKFVYSKMIAASSKIAEHTSPLVFLGVRDWDHLNRWERINVSSCSTSTPFRLPCS